MNSIKSFVEALQQRQNSSTVSNPYLEADSSHNLKQYLLALNKLDEKRLLLVGEALGFKGGLLTGIPFSSGKLLQQSEHPFIKLLRPKLKLNDISAENTASIVWQYLEEKSITSLCWNAFPFHPHLENNPLTNRAPNKAEIEEGIEYLRAYYRLYKPEVIVGVGAKGVAAANLAFPKKGVVAARHPSYGGKKAFITKLNEVI